MINLINFLEESEETGITCDKCIACFANGPELPYGLYNLVHDALTLIQVLVPILLIIWGMIDFAKGVVSNDEDKIAAGRKAFLQRLIAGILVLLVITGVKFVFNLTSNLDSEDAIEDSMWDCVGKFIGGVEEPSS